MKDLIKKILKEETDSDEKLNIAMKIVITSIRKKFPFIVGWKIHSLKFKYTYYINLLIDPFEAAKYYDSEIATFYEKNPEFLYDDHPYPFSFLKFKNTLSDDEKYDLYKEINEEAKYVYDILPHELNMSGKKIDIETFIAVKKN
jgi:hypothetical protein